MKWGEVWTLSGGPGYAGKPRPALILQADWLDDTGSVITCGITSRHGPVLRARPALEPSPANGLHKPSEIMLDKVIAVRRERLGEKIGVLGEDDMERVRRTMMLVLGFAG